ncbi:MAG: hypothetical protein GYA23_06685 [Methanomicrobiales archaeon]|nr:hypothetical protein [Methanomicrobiales archaeon]
MHFKSCPDCKQLTAIENPTCPYCGYSFERTAANSPQGAGTKAGSDTKSEIRNPLIAAFCAFLFAGWGHWYNGRTAEGIYIIAANTAVVIISVLLLLFFRGSAMTTTAILVVTGIVLLVIWVYSIASAYNTARGINRGGTPYTGKSLLFWMPATLYFLVVGLIAITIASTFVPALPGAGMVPSLARAGALIPIQLIGL